MKGADLADIIGSARKPFQLVYLSSSSDRLNESLQSFQTHYGADRVLILCPENCLTSMQAVLAGLDVKGVILHDEQVLPDISKVREHSARNFELRRALYQREEIEPLFLSLDDDCILLRPLPHDHFIQNGKIVARYSHEDLGNWRSDGISEPVSFDLSQWNTAERLNALDYPQKGYAAHQAQLVEKRTVNEIYQRFQNSNMDPLDEWSLYFNVAVTDYPENFVAKSTTTLFWPARYVAWMPPWFDDEIWFENRYPDLYQDGGIAAEAGISKDCDWRIKAGFCRAGYASYQAMNLLNELSNGGPPVLEIGNTISANVRQLFGIPGIVLKLQIHDSQEREVPVRYLVTQDGKPVVETISPTQKVGVRRNLAIRLPANPGEYLITFGRESEEASPITLPLFVLPYPAGGNC